MRTQSCTARRLGDSRMCVFVLLIDSENVKKATGEEASVAQIIGKDGNEFQFLLFLVQTKKKYKL